MVHKVVSKVPCGSSSPVGNMIDVQVMRISKYMYLDLPKGAEWVIKGT